MKSKSTVPTLENIGKLIDQKFDQKLLPVFGELDGIKQQVSETNLDVKILRREVKEGFDTVFDGLDSINRILDKDHEPRLKRLETKVFAQ